MLDFTH